jgi:hypothetical protein
MGYSTRLLDSGHRDDVLRLWQANMSDQKIRSVLDERYQWLYERNPAGPAITVLAFDDGTGAAIGCGSAYPRLMRIGDDVVQTAIAADFAVDRRHRLGGAALTIQRALLEAHKDRFAFLFCFPNKAAAPVFRKIGYEPVGTVKGWVKPLRSGYKLADYVKSGPLARALAPPLDAGLAIADAVRALRRGTCRGEPLDSFDERFDQLWERHQQRHEVVGDRGSAYLTWRYRAFTTLEYRTFGLFKGNELLGWVVYFTRDGKVFVADAFVSDTAQLMAPLLIAFSRAMRRQGYLSASVSCLMNDMMTSIVGAVGFFQAAAADRQMMACPVTATEPQRQLVANASHWTIFDGEMDI